MIKVDNKSWDTPSQKISMQYNEYWNLEWMNSYITHKMFEDTNCS